MVQTKRNELLLTLMPTLQNLVKLDMIVKRTQLVKDQHVRPPTVAGQTYPAQVGKYAILKELRRVIMSNQAIKLLPQSKMGI